MFFNGIQLSNNKRVTENFTNRHRTILHEFTTKGNLVLLFVEHKVIHHTYMNYAKEIGANELKNIRKQFGKRQEDVAALFGFDITDRLSHWENGIALPNLINVFRLCAIYKKYPHELYPELFRAITNETD